jgi:hypothetical protein
MGYANQKFFYQFLFYATVGDFISFTCLLSRLGQINLNVQLKKGTQPSIFEILYIMSDPLVQITGTIFALSMTISIGFLLFFQTKMLIYNLTTIENKNLEDPTNHQFYYPNLRHNFETVMGDKILFWFLPLFESNKYNTGYVYSTPDKDNIGFESKSYAHLGDVESSRIDHS